MLLAAVPGGYPRQSVVDLRRPLPRPVTQRPGSSFASPSGQAREKYPDLHIHVSSERSLLAMKAYIVQREARYQGYQGQAVSLPHITQQCRWTRSGIHQARWHKFQAREQRMRWEQYAEVNQPDPRRSRRILPRSTYAGASGGAGWPVVDCAVVANGVSQHCWPRISVSLSRHLVPWRFVIVIAAP